MQPWLHSCILSRLETRAADSDRDPVLSVDFKKSIE